MYNEHFGFTDHRQRYAGLALSSSPVLRGGYATLEYGIDARKGFVIVTGDRVPANNAAEAADVQPRF